jgi:hypothetical protein
VQGLLDEIMQDMEYIASMRNALIEAKEDAVRKKAGMKTLELPPGEAEKFVKTCYDKTWEFVIQSAPEYGPKLREVSSKKAVPPNTFPWQ